jgi:hypothetical protein
VESNTGPETELSLITATPSQMQYFLLRSADVATSRKKARRQRSHSRQDEPLSPKFNSGGNDGDTAPPLQQKFAQEHRRDA